MHTDILQFLNHKRILFLSVDITCQLQLSYIMEHSCYCKLIALFMRQSHLLCNRISQITYQHSMMQFRSKVKFQDPLL